MKSTNINFFSKALLKCLFDNKNVTYYYIDEMKKTIEILQSAPDENFIFEHTH